MKYIIVGTSHAGYEVIQTLLKEDTNAEIQVFESADEPSFLSCGIQSYLENVSPSLDSLHYASAASYKEQGVDIHTNSTQLQTSIPIIKRLLLKKMVNLKNTHMINYS